MKKKINYSPYFLHLMFLNLLPNSPSLLNIYPRMKIAFPGKLNDSCLKS